MNYYDILRILSITETCKDRTRALLTSPIMFDDNQMAVLCSYYISLHDLNKNTVEVKKTESAAEALAYASNLPFTVTHGVKDMGPTTNILPGDTLTVQIGRRPDFIEDNWYKLLSGAALALGIFNSLK